MAPASRPSVLPPAATRGERRRRELLEATVRILGREGIDAVTHRAVAEEAGAAHGSTTHYFATRENLVEEALRFVAEREIEAVEALSERVAAAATSPQASAERVVDFLAASMRDRAARIAHYELFVESARRPSLQPTVRRWLAAYLALAEPALRAAGSREPAAHARILVAAVHGLLLEELAAPHPRFETDVLRPSVGCLVRALIAAPPR